jgi:hypothetical protein
VDELAAEHAVHWGAEPPSLAEIENAVQPYSEKTGEILAALQPDLNQKEICALEEILNSLPGLLRSRAGDPQGYTLIDLPVDSSGGDHRGLSPGLGGYSLARLLVLELSTEERRRAEFHALRHYARGLREHEITYYLDRILEDYRLGIAQCILEALADWNQGFSPDSLEQIRRILAGYLDFGAY